MRKFESIQFDNVHFDSQLVELKFENGDRFITCPKLKKEMFSESGT